MARKLSEKTKLESDVSITSFDVKSLKTNVPHKEAIEFAIKRLSEPTAIPKLSRESMKNYQVWLGETYFNCSGW